MPKIVITGANSLLGLGLIKKIPQKFGLYLTHHNHPVHFNNLKSSFLDIRDQNSVNKLIYSQKPDIIIHAAAISDVDWCQKNRKAAAQTNIHGTKNVIGAAQKIGAKIVFISTNAVFDGRHAPYKETDQTSPINFYGKTKVEGERLTQTSQLPFLIIRLITMYGWPPGKNRDNPVTWQLKKMAKNQTLNMVSDRYITPLYNLAAAEAIYSAITKNKTGIYHVSGADRVSRFKFAKLAAHIFGYNQNLIHETTSDFFKNLAPRPLDTSYETSKMQKELKIKPLSLKKGLKLMLAEKVQYANSVPSI